MVLSIPILSLLVVSACLYIVQRQNREVERLVDRHLETGSHVQTVLALLLDAETGMRGYLLTRDSDFLEPYHRARREIDPAIQRLGSLVQDHPEQRDRIDQLSRLAARRLEILDEAVTQGRLSHDLLTEERETTDRLRDLLEALSQEEERRLQARILQGRRPTDWMDLLFAASLALGLGGGFLAILLLTRGVARREAEEALGQEARRMAAVIATQNAIATAELTLEPLMRLIVSRTQALTGAAGAVLELPEGDELVYRVATGTASPHLGLRLKVTASLTGQSFLQGEILRCDDAESDPRVNREATRKLGVRSMVVVPLKYAGEVLGVLKVLSPRPHAFTDQDVDTLQLMAGLTAAALGHATDFEAKKTALEALQASEERFRSLVTNIPGTVYRCAWDPEWTMEYLSDGVESLTGYPARDFLGNAVRSFASILHPEDRERVRQEVLEAERLRRPFEIEYRIVHAQGGLRWVYDRGQAMYAETGEIRWLDGVMLDITDRKEAHQAMEEARREAERANQAKSQFLSRMSHELRTPLNAILGFAQLLEMADEDPEHQEAIHQILKGGKHLLELINEILDIARIEAGRLALSLEPVQVEEVVQEALDLIQPLAAQRNVRIQNEVGVEDDGFVLADRQRLKQVLLNLLSNAVKYNREGGEVRIGSGRHEDEMVIWVRDTGPGIPTEKLPQLFVPFERLGAERTEVEGTGLGLALSRRLVEAMRGELEVESQVGVGSTFSVRLPGIEDPVARHEQARPLPVTPEVELPGEDAKILYVEDNLSNLKLMEKILLQRPGVQLLAAMQGSLGLDLAREHRPDLILLDLNLPDMTGEEVLRHLQAAPRTREIPVIVVSAEATPGKMERLIAAGARAYLTKPLNVRELLQVMGEALERTEREGPEDEN